MGFMKKNYNTPETSVLTIATTAVICASVYLRAPQTGDGGEPF